MLRKNVLYSGIFAVGAVLLALPYVYYMAVYNSPGRVAAENGQILMDGMTTEVVRLLLVVFLSCLIGLSWGKKVGLAGLGHWRDLQRNWQRIVFFGLVMGVLVYLFGDRYFLQMAPGFYPTELKYAIFIPFYAALVEEVFARFGVMTFFSKVFRNPHVGNVLAALIFAMGHVSLFKVAGIIYRLNYITACSFILNVGISLFFGYIYWRKGLVMAMGIHFIANLRYVVIALML